jgi:hypothetical protein
LVANHGYSYFFVALDPGQHAVCTDWQSGINTYSRQSAATSFNAEASKIYFSRTTVMEITALQIKPGSSSALSTPHAKK